jgi:hypothetical protein
MVLAFLFDPLIFNSRNGRTPHELLKLGISFMPFRKVFIKYLSLLNMPFQPKSLEEAVTLLKEE